MSPLLYEAALEVTLYLNDSSHVTGRMLRHLNPIVRNSSEGPLDV